MRILISGSTGFIGTFLHAHLRSEGHEVTPLVRDRKSVGIFFSIEHPEELLPHLEGFDVIIHLGGENISHGRWTAAKKRRISKSRIESAHVLAKVIEQLSSPPKQFLCASATGYFGERGDRFVTEDSSLGTGFLAELCKNWEKAAETKSVETTHLRFGMILGPRGYGSALDPMILLTRLGFSAVLGNGSQYISWMHIDDVTKAISWIIDAGLKGPVNICSQVPVPQKEFAKTLAKLLHRPCFLQIPAPILSFMIGEMADELLLKSVRALPEKLLQSGFTMQYPRLQAAIKNILFPGAMQG